MPKKQGFYTRVEEGAVCYWNQNAKPWQTSRKLLVAPSEDVKKSSVFRGQSKGRGSATNKLRTRCSFTWEGEAQWA
jgi:hypothetical protein